jgi:hypothetical protein
MVDLTGLIGRLTQARVEFVVVGAYAAILHGATVVTRDVDVCMPFTADNLFRLRDALADLHPWHRMTPQHLPLELNETNVAALSNLYLATDLGPLDCLSEINAVGRYDVVLARSVVVKASFGEIRVIDIDSLLAAKSQLMRLQDKLVIPQLLAIKERQRVKSS